jgi:hypothetical protein
MLIGYARTSTLEREACQGWPGQAELMAYAIAGYELSQCRTSLVWR